MSKEEVLESLSPDERAIIPYLKTGNIDEIIKKSGLNEVKVIRSLQFLENKGVVKLKISSEKIVDLDENGVIYLKNGLPERRLLNVLSEKPEISLIEAKEKSKLSENEFQVALGTLKKKALIDLKEGKIQLKATLDEIAKKSLEEQLIDALPLEYEKLVPEQQHALKSLKTRKQIVIIKEKKIISFELTILGKEISKQDICGLGSTWFCSFKIKYGKRISK